MPVSPDSAVQWNDDALARSGFRLLRKKPEPPPLPPPLKREDSIFRRSKPSSTTTANPQEVLTLPSICSFCEHRDNFPALWRALTKMLRDHDCLNKYDWLEVPSSGKSSCFYFDAKKLAKHHHLFLGHDASSGDPILLSRKVLSEHAHIMGSSGTGKTAKGVVPLIEQLIGFRDSAMVIIDLKGDMTLFHATKNAAKLHGLEFKWFTTEVGCSSYAFNPLLQDDSRFLSAKQCSESLAEALGLDHGEGYGVSFYSRVNRNCLAERFNARAQAGTPITSFQQLSQLLKENLHGREKQDAYELQSAVDLLASFDQLNVNNDKKSAESPQEEKARTTLLSNAIQMSDVLKQKQIVYFNLPQALEGSSAREIGRLVINALFQSCYHAHRIDEDPPQYPRVYLVIDEFQNVVGKSFTAILEQARSMGLAVILSHQHLAQLRKRQNEDYRDIIKGTRFKHFFSAELGSETQEYILRASGEAWVEEPNVRAASASSYSARINSRIPTNDIIELSDDPDLSIIHVRSGAGFSQFKGYPFILRSTFHITEAEWKTRLKGKWDDPDADKQKTIDVLRKPKALTLLAKTPRPRTKLKRQDQGEATAMPRKRLKKADASGTTQSSPPLIA